MGYKVLTKDDNLFTEEQMTLEFANGVNVEFDLKDFGAPIVKKFTIYKFVEKYLWYPITWNYQVVKKTHANSYGIEAIS